MKKRLKLNLFVGHYNIQVSDVLEKLISGIYRKVFPNK